MAYNSCTNQPNNPPMERHCRPTCLLNTTTHITCVSACKRELPFLPLLLVLFSRTSQILCTHPKRGPPENRDHMIIHRSPPLMAGKYTRIRSPIHLATHEPIYPPAQKPIYPHIHEPIHNLPIHPFTSLSIHRPINVFTIHLTIHPHNNKTI